MLYYCMVSSTDAFENWWSLSLSIQNVLKIGTISFAVFLCIILCLVCKIFSFTVFSFLCKKNHLESNVKKFREAGLINRAFQYRTYSKSVPGTLAQLWTFRNPALQIRDIEKNVKKSLTNLPHKNPARPKIQC